MEALDRARCQPHPDTLLLCRGGPCAYPVTRGKWWTWLGDATRGPRFFARARRAVDLPHDMGRAIEKQYQQAPGVHGTAVSLSARRTWLGAIPRAAAWHWRLRR